MDEQVVKLKRGWVKNAAIVFLSIMLVLTFFSNTILNRSLPEVAASYVESGSINAKIRGSGTVTAGESYEVVLDQTRQVDAVFVHVGDTVMTGDVLFSLADTESEELKQAQKTLDNLRLAYEKALLNLDSADYAQENRNIQKAREALAEAQQELLDSTVTAEEINAALLNLKDNERVQKQLETTLSDNEAYLARVKGEYDALDAKIETWESQLETMEKTVEDYEKQIKSLKNGSGDLEDELYYAQRDLDKAKKDYADLRVIYGKDYNELKNSAESNADGSDVIYLMEAMVKNRDATDPQKIAFEKLQPALDKVDFLTEKVAEYETLVEGSSSVDEQLDKLYDALDDAEDELYELEDDIDEAYDELEDLELAVERTEFQVVSLEEQVAAQKDTVEQLDEHYNTLKDKENDYKSAKDRVESCQDTLDDLTFALAEQKKADGKIAASQQLDLDNSLKEIQEQEEIVAKLQSNSTGAEVTAKVSGQISSLNVTAGRDANAGETLAVIEVVDRGYTVRLPVTNEQSQKVRIGDKATVSNYYWGEELDVTLTQIVNDPSKPGQGKMLVFTINGDVSSGQNVTLSVGERSANYDSIVPNSAVRTDTNGTFVLVLTVKSSPLGNRYIATRVDVNVLAQDDTMAAVSGLSMGDYVITTSSKPLEAGMQVNMVEN
ncbi:MAG: HlyD family efflux transporter periplasmic adaptor subunit [Ruminococcaceae bacterium]|nr:HlyD family efflux transporter periplasmic adaptor subunit [Oscillospiraceae bacterium]